MRAWQDDAGAVTGVACRLAWAPGTRTAVAVGRALSDFAVSHAAMVAVEDFEVQPSEHTVHITLRAGAGCADQLERVVLQLVDAL